MIYFTPAPHRTQPTPFFFLSPPCGFSSTEWVLDSRKGSRIAKSQFYSQENPHDTAVLGLFRLWSANAESKKDHQLQRHGKQENLPPIIPQKQKIHKAQHTEHQRRDNPEVIFSVSEHRVKHQKCDQRHRHPEKSATPRVPSTTKSRTRQTPPPKFPSPTRQ